MDRTEFIGNLVRDPETRDVNGKTVCNFTVAVNHIDKNKNETAKFYRVAAWNRLGEICSQFLFKGKKVYVDGTVNARAYQTRSGEYAASLEVMAWQVEFLSGNQAEAAPARQDAQTGFDEADYPDDLPF